MTSTFAARAIWSVTSNPGISRTSGSSFTSPCWKRRSWKPRQAGRALLRRAKRSEEHTSELQSLMRISYAVFGLNKKNDLTVHWEKTQNNYYIHLHNNHDNNY